MRRAEEIKRQKAVLEAKLAELMAARLRREDITVETAADEMDNHQLAAERELVISYLDMGSSLRRSITAALARFEDRSYGTCLHCEKPIAPKRLRALPWAAYCVRCQEAVDRGELEVEDLEKGPEFSDAA